MGTNFYLMSKSKKLIRENFAVEKNYGVTDVEYELVDEPYLGWPKGRKQSLHVQKSRMSTDYDTEA